MTEKEAVRREILARRDALPDRAERSRRVVAQVLALPEFRQAASLAAFVGVRTEVSTEELIARCLELGKRVALPHVAGGEIELVEIRDLAELSSGPYGLRQPSAALAADPDRRADLSRLDLLLIPGVAFDRSGGRLGHGKGYYDRLLRRVTSQAVRVGLAFECQVVDEVPMRPTDERVAVLVTEEAVYRFNP
jgi:5-formyltetrahydrofolate cyclo-ligase